MVTEVATKHCLSIAAKVKNLQNNPKFHMLWLSMSFHGTNSSSGSFHPCTKLCHTEREKTAPFIQGSYSYELFKFHDLFKFSKTLGVTVSFKTFTNFPCFGVFFDLKQFNGHKLWCLTKCVPFELAVSVFDYSSLSHTVLALSSAVTNLSNETLNFPWLSRTDN